jgi:hypothetical protein
MLLPGFSANHRNGPDCRQLYKRVKIRHCMVMSSRDSPQASPLEDSILDVLMRASSGTLSAPEIAHAIAPEGDWHGLLMPIRRAAVALARAGRLVIYRKGKPADPEDFRGVYRLGLPRQD